MILYRKLLCVMVTLIIFSVSVAIIAAQPAEETALTKIIEALQSLHELTLQHIALTGVGLVITIATILISSRGTEKTIKAVQGSTGETIKALQHETNIVVQTTISELVRTSGHNMDQMAGLIKGDFKKNAVLQGVLSSKKQPLTPSDIMKAVKEVDNFFEEIKITDFQERLKGKTVSQIMTKGVITVTPNTTLSEFFETLKKSRKSGYPVVDRGNIVGIVSTMKDFFTIDPKDWGEKTIKDIMKTDLVLATPTENVIEVMKKMKERDIGRVPVVEAMQLVGIVSRQNINALIEELVS